MKPTAIIYDFDGTLSPGTMQQHTLLPELGYKEASDFWRLVKAKNREVDGDEILTYMHMLLSAHPEAITLSALWEHGASLPFFPGVLDWFQRMNFYAKARGLDLEHYVISSGLQEMIDGSLIRPCFQHVFASRYTYANDRACWPAVAVNYTTKTQYLFRINKGIENNWDDAAVNAFIPMKDRRIPFERMIFLGDGDTDIPTMKMLKYQGGTAIAVFDEERFKGPDQKKVYKLIAEDRANYVCPANYTDGSHLDVTVKGVLGRIARAEGYIPGDRS
jgi:2-hydroxy-3-keto-5-methylthiopentenyl-1-phosphate phosphatase